MDLLTKTLCDIEIRLSRIEEKLESILPQTQRMAEHVDNVEHVAQNTPLVSKLLHWDNRPKQRALTTTNEWKATENAPWP